MLKTAVTVSKLDKGCALKECLLYFSGGGMAFLEGGCKVINHAKERCRDGRSVGKVLDAPEVHNARADISAENSTRQVCFC